MFYVFAWCSQSEKAFNDGVPLDLLADSWVRHGSTIPVTVVFLEGHDRLSAAYTSALAAKGIKCIDYSANFSAIVVRHPNISAHYSHYERNCFLRWIAFAELVNATAEPGQVWHLDGDVILHASTDSLASDTAGKTFVLQGCPVFVSISDLRWFMIYIAELRKLEADIIGYSSVAAASRSEISRRDRELCNSSVYRNPIGSDQDLLEYLISAGIQIQDLAANIFKSEFFFAGSPLMTLYWASEQDTLNTALVVEHPSGELWIGQRRIPFVHYHNDFCQYGDVWLILRKVGLEAFTPFSIDPVRGTVNGAQSPYRWLRWTLRNSGLRKFKLKMPARRQIILELSKPGRTDHGTRLSDILNHLTTSAPERL